MAFYSFHVIKIDKLLNCNSNNNNNNKSRMISNIIIDYCGGGAGAAVH